MFKLIIVLVACLTFCRCGLINKSSEEDLDWDSFDHSTELKKENYILDSGANNRYWLYTRNNPDVPQLIIHGRTDTVLASNYDPNKPLKVIVHGWGGSINSPVNAAVKSSFLKVVDANILVLDWGLGTVEEYIPACLRVPSTGRYLGNFIDWMLKAAGGSWESVHLVGYSLGAHIVGNAGREVNGQPKRVTGLDPAGPLWWDNTYALHIDDGLYVEVIHTDLLRRGLAKAIGHVDFYPNGARSPQPGCNNVSCSHDRAYKFFASSLEFNNFIGRQCTDVVMAIIGNCNGSTLRMGNVDLSKTGSGIYTLETTDIWPFY